MWKISARAFLELSPRLYMMMPHPTEQYGQVLRVSVLRASLKCGPFGQRGGGREAHRDETRSGPPGGHLEELAP